MNRKKRRAVATVALACAAVALATGRTAQAWNRPGHMVVGSIAFVKLKTDDPAAVQRMVTSVEWCKNWPA